MAGILQIGASVNVAELKAGMEEAAGSVRAQAGQMSAAFQGLAAESKASTTQIASSWVGVAQATLGLSAAQSSVRSATRAAKEAEDDDTAALARLALAKRDAAVASAALAAAQEAATGGAQRLGNSMISTSLLARGLGQDIGIGIPRVVGSFLASIGGVAAALEVAFPAIAVIALGEALEKQIPKIKEWIESWMGVAQYKEQILETVAAMNKLRLELFGIETAHRKAAEIGTEGLLKQSLALKNAEADAKQYHQAINGDKGAGIESQQAKLDQLEAHLLKFKAAAIDSALAAHYAMTGELPVFQTEDEIKKAEEAVKKQQAYVDDLRAKSISANEEVERARRELAAASRKEAEADDKATVDAQKKRDLDLLASREAGIKQARADYKISAQDELEDLNTVSDLKLAAIQRYVNDSIALLNKEHATTGQNVTPQVTGLESESFDAAVRNLQEKAANQAKFAADQKKQAREVAMAQIDATAEVADAQVRLDDQTARESYASHKATADQETALLIAAENERADAHRAKLQAQLAEDQKEPEKYAAAILTLNGEIEAAEKDHQARLAAIRAEGDRKAIEDARKLADEEASAAEKTARSILESTIRLDDEKLKHHRMSVAEWARDEIAAVEAAEQQELQIVDQQLAKLRALGLQDTANYKAAQDRKIEITREAANKIEQIEQQQDNQIAQRFNQLFTSMASTITNSLNSVIEGHKTMAQAVTQIWQGLAMDVIKSIEQVITKLLVELAVAAAVNALTGGVSDIAGGLTSGELIPGATGAATAGFASGGIIPRTGFILAHEKEGILPRSLTSMLLNVANNGGPQASSSGHTFHVNYQPIINHPMTRDDVDEHASYLFSRMRQMQAAFNS